MDISYAAGEIFGGVLAIYLLNRLFKLIGRKLLKGKINRYYFMLRIYTLISFGLSIMVTKLIGFDEFNTNLVVYGVGAWINFWASIAAENYNSLKKEKLITV